MPRDPHEMRQLLKRPAFLVPLLVLVAAVGVQFTNMNGEVPSPRPAHLNNFVQQAPEGWRARDVPLGPNEFLEGQVEKVLNFDEVVHREYSRGAVTFAVYAAYWGPGRMPTRLVASHTPDRCWTENGWTCLEMKFKEANNVGATALQPAEWRLFRSPAGDNTNVLFWHLVDGRIYDYGSRFTQIPDPVRWWKDAIHQAFRGSGEQYFVRVTSNVSFAEIWDEPGFQHVMRGLAELGLAEMAK
jgi:hypothetical protein